MAHPVRCVACGATDVPLEQTCPACGHVPAVARLGTTIVGRYAIEALLGQGGFGVVYRAVHLALAQPVALKFLSASWAGSPEIRARFQREAFTLARLRHPGIVAVHDFGEVDGSLFLAMELVEGQTLASSLPEDRPLPDARIVELLDQIGDVLAAAHAAGVVHRDLKPENVMVSHDRVKLLDFGLALMVEPGAARLTRTNAIQGTPTYMSPEQCRGRDVGPATDVYALGVMLYELLTGRPPFDGSAALELMTQHAFVDPPPMREVGFRREVHPGLEALARAALAKRAEDRPTIAAFRAELRRALAGVDAASERVRQVDARIAFAALDRDERALEPPPAAPTLPAGEGLVVLVGFEIERGLRLRDALSVHGFQVVVGVAASDARPLDVVVVPEIAAQEGLGFARDRACALVVVDVESASSTPRWIRAGVSDVALRHTPDEAIAVRLRRLLRRRPR
ncbi:MAG: serine/threonine protein kinase [Myxococcales bacterium]|nr:serine/threonine protein kinase [Myxococcales bacterium]